MMECEESTEEYERFSELCLELLHRLLQYDVKILVHSTPRVVTNDFNGPPAVGLYCVSTDGLSHRLDWRNELTKTVLTALALGRGLSTAPFDGYIGQMFLKFVWVQDRTEGAKDIIALSPSQRCAWLIDDQVRKWQNELCDAELGADIRSSIVMAGNGVALASQRVDGGGWRCVRSSNPELEDTLQKLARKGPGYEAYWTGTDVDNFEELQVKFQFVVYCVLTMGPR